MLRFLTSLGLASVLLGSPAFATENIVFVSGAFRRTIFVKDLEDFVQTGVPQGLLADLNHRLPIERKAEA